eukprot:TRINITY_DN2540_c0_g1_i1.p1 TRINITY_DN2540_c0_g1~~TRINITY_DN2540_c0_g1_i1.p1  ORF type:complete len:681 (+),score=249.91 TRINITY_DN2540_c0_g1_i1:126-2168(+)
MNTDTMNPLEVMVMDEPEDSLMKEGVHHRGGSTVASPSSMKQRAMEKQVKQTLKTSHMTLLIIGLIVVLAGVILWLAIDTSETVTDDNEIFHNSFETVVTHVDTLEDYLKEKLDLMEESIHQDIAAAQSSTQLDIDSAKDESIQDTSVNIVKSQNTLIDHLKVKVLRGRVVVAEKTYYDPMDSSVVLTGVERAEITADIVEYTGTLNTGVSTYTKTNYNGDFSIIVPNDCELILSVSTKEHQSKAYQVKIEDLSEYTEETIFYPTLESGSSSGSLFYMIPNTAVGKTVTCSITVKEDGNDVVLTQDETNKIILHKLDPASAFLEEEADTYADFTLDTTGGKSVITLTAPVATTYQLDIKQTNFVEKSVNFFMYKEGNNDFTIELDTYKNLSGKVCNIVSGDCAGLAGRTIKLESQTRPDVTESFELTADGFTFTNLAPDEYMLVITFDDYLEVYEDVTVADDHVTGLNVNIVPRCEPRLTCLTYVLRWADVNKDLDLILVSDTSDGTGTQCESTEGAIDACPGQTFKQSANRGPGPETATSVTREELHTYYAVIDSRDDSGASPWFSETSLNGDVHLDIYDHWNKITTVKIDENLQEDADKGKRYWIAGGVNGVSTAPEGCAKCPGYISDEATDECAENDVTQADCYRAHSDTVFEDNMVSSSKRRTPSYTPSSSSSGSR